MADATETTIDADAAGFARRATLTGMGLVSEGIGTLKLLGGEVLDVTETASTQTLDAVDRIAEDLAGPFAELVKVPTAALRATVGAGSAATRTVLQAA
ncbi:MAG: hypothetical protein KDA97_07010 [Acidimicrobiales bacterium]|nr:hypothetical protein [Acidimicrobiales bacterium]